VELLRCGVEKTFCQNYSNVCHSTDQSSAKRCTVGSHMATELDLKFVPKSINIVFCVHTWILFHFTILSTMDAPFKKRNLQHATHHQPPSPSPSRPASSRTQRYSARAAKIAELNAAGKLGSFKCCDNRACFAVVDGDKLSEDTKAMSVSTTAVRNKYLRSLYDCVSEMYTYNGRVVCYEFLTKSFGFSREMQWSNKKFLKRAYQMLVVKGIVKILDGDSTRRGAHRVENLDGTDTGGLAELQETGQSGADGRGTSGTKSDGIGRRDVASGVNQEMAEQGHQKMDARAHDEDQDNSTDTTMRPSLPLPEKNGFVVIRGNECTPEEPFWVGKVQSVRKRGAGVTKLRIHWFQKEGDAFESRYKPCFVLNTPTPWCDFVDPSSVIATFPSLPEMRLPKSIFQDLKLHSQRLR